MSQTKKFRSNIMRNIENHRGSFYGTNISTLKLGSGDDD